MILSEMITEYRLQTPMALDAGITDAVLTQLFNKGAIECNLYGRIYFDFAEFTATISQQRYNISEITELSNYLGIGSGIIYYKNSSSKYVEIYPKTQEWFNQNISDWRTATSGDPQYYFIKGDLLAFDRAFSSARTVRFEEYLKKPIDMSNGNNYPWNNSTTEITAFIPMDQAIITYAKWKTQSTLGKDEQGNYRGGSTFKEFLTEIRKARRMIGRRSDLYHLDINKMRVS